MFIQTDNGQLINVAYVKSFYGMAGYISADLDGDKPNTYDVWRVEEGDGQQELKHIASAIEAGAKIVRRPPKMSTDLGKPIDAMATTIQFDLATPVELKPKTLGGSAEARATILNAQFGGSAEGAAE